MGDAATSKDKQGWASGSLSKGSFQNLQQQQNPDAAVTVETERDSVHVCVSVRGWIEEGKLWGTSETSIFWPIFHAG